MITKHSRISEIKKLPELKECKNYLLGDGLLGAFGGIFHLDKITDDDMASNIAEGANHMVELIHGGYKIFYTLYDEKQAAQDRGLMQQVMFHFPVAQKSKAVVICPGGGYSMVCSLLEGFTLAKRANELGYHAFVVNYRTGKDARAPHPQDDLACALRYIFKNADTLNVEPNDYLLGGASAGAHLAGTFATKNVGYAQYKIPKPGALFLAYPVITMGEKTHSGSRKNLLGKEDVTPQMVEKYSIECNVTKDYPPVYIWQCDRDNTVPIENSQMMVKALKEQGVKYIYKTYDSDVHGWGLAMGKPAQGWLDAAIDFWEMSTKSEN